MIRSITVEPVRMSPAGAELIVRVGLDAAAGVEVRGTLVGPRCAGISTVEVAYDLRPVPGADDTALVLRAVIPEPNMWSPAAPFRYDGRVGVWRDGVRVDDHRFAVELRPPQS
ncbi:MAG: hypothetical protein JWO38_1050 [Gemmataceae bacterium]|nr:hypothetical protein [Gemmataceae bacterium]